MFLLLVACTVRRSRVGVRRVSSSSESDAAVSAVDSLVLLHALPARHRQPGAVSSLHHSTSVTRRRRREGFCTPSGHVDHI